MALREQKSVAFCNCVREVRIELGFKSLRLYRFAKRGMAQVAVQEFGDYITFRHRPKQADWTAIWQQTRSFRCGQGVNQERYRHDNEKCRQNYQLNHDDLVQG